MRRLWWAFGDIHQPLSPEEREQISCSLTIVFDGTGVGVPWGSRAGTPTQCFFLDESDVISPDELAKIMARYPYRDLPMGPILAPGYNGFYPDTDWIGRPDEYADRLELMLSYGKRFVYHALPDQRPYWNGPELGWDWGLIQRDFEPVYRHPRVQAAIDRVVVAWEPPNNTLNSVWLSGCEWLADVFPNAMRFIHCSPDHNAPCASEHDVPDGEAWHKVAPYVHGFLYQSSMMGEGREDQFLFDTEYVQKHFDQGINGWPTFGADGRKLFVIGYEYASYWRHNGATPSNEPGDTWGHDLMARHYVRGFGDGARGVAA